MITAYFAHQHEWEQFTYLGKVGKSVNESFHILIYTQKAQLILGGKIL